ncbi:hypothetical protein D049_4147B, partial [Vibrio parahaemolyticus VPTS-2010]
GVRP